MKEFLCQILEAPDQETTLSRLVNGFILTLILLSVFVVILATVGPLRERFATFFFAFEVVTVVVFSLEYLARLWIADITPEFEESRYPRLAYAFSFGGIVDLLAILPFYLPLVLPMDLRFIRILRLFRLVRAMKLGRYSDAIDTMVRVVKSRKEELVVSVSIVLVLLLFASTIMYALEAQAQPEAFSSIPEAMWWGVATLTTVGYGDVYPITPLGRFFGALIAIFCLGLFALPAGIIAGGFTEELQNKEKPTCPHCGKEIES